MAVLEHLEKKVRQLERRCLDHKIIPIEGAQGTRIMVEGRELIQLSANNYLGLTSHPRVREAARKALEEAGAGAGGVRVMAGTFDRTQALEQKLAAFKKTEAAVVFSAGYTTNLGVMSSIPDKGDIVLSDAYNHISILEGIRLSKAEMRSYNHNDMEDLERALAESQNYRQRIVVTDGVFSMDGDIAPLPEIVDLVEKYNAILIVDDSHSNGVFGENGRGTVDHFGLHDRVHIQVGTFSKAFGVMGGFVASSKIVCDYLMQHANSFIYSTAHPPSTTAACMAALDVVMDEPEILERLWDNTRFFRNGLKELGFDTGKSESPIIPVMVGDAKLASRFADHLYEAGLMCKSVAFPTVALGEARIRVIITAAHSHEEMEQALKIFERIGKDLKIVT
ncbi:glycine C-acetyltransferase [Brevibacillus dissolubilis]|uniref:glycine C-acetyltransferase n=1 Tax=Brevibacillus dissolubilis TaxID=1844116 RepID=UPI001116020D|nr:glycine C-acetyltransferase [Brevibacillus dissolubilis]